MDIPDKNGKTLLDKVLDKINDGLAGVRKAFRVSSVSGLNKVFELGRNNVDMQFLELLIRSKTEIVSAYSLTMSDLGDGEKSLTYNNATTFSYNVYGKIGHLFEEKLDELTNDFFLPFYGINTTENAYFDYLPPNNPDRLQVVEQARKDWESNKITLNETREISGLEPVENGDVFFKDWTQKNQQPPQTQQEIQNAIS